MKPVEQMSCAALRDRLARVDRPVVLDCREREEVAIARIEGAVHIPMGDIPSRQTELDPDAEIVVVCHHGVRANKVAAFLKEQGFTNVKNLAGGIDAWSLEVDPRVARY